MVVISYATLREFYTIHADATDALNNWYRILLRSDCSNYHEMKVLFNSVDSVGNDRYVFNIRGNNYRIVALIFLIFEPFISDLLVHIPPTTKLIVPPYKVAGLPAENIADYLLLIVKMEKITNDASYNEVMAKIDSLMAKGSQNVSKEELEKIHALALYAQAFEQEKYIIDAPTTLTGMIEMRMFELKLKQKDLAEKLNVSNAKLSLIMNGKQRPDIAFLKAVHSQLQVDANFILEHA